MFAALFRLLGLSKKREAVDADLPPLQFSLNNLVENSLQEVKSYHEKTEKKDAWEGWYYDHEKGDFPIVIEADIRYIDINNQLTNRRITTKRFRIENFDGKDDFIVLAHCHLRQQNRTFKLSRIQEFIDISTGELINDIPSYFPNNYEMSSSGQTVRLIEKVNHELTVLLYIARADTRLSAKEKSVLVGFLRRVSPKIELDMTIVDAAFSDVPSQANLKRAIKSVIDMGKVEIVLEHVEELSNSRAKMDDFTSSAILLVKKRLLLNKELSKSDKLKRKETQ